jgi:hypothetical protein
MAGRPQEADRDPLDRRDGGRGGELRTGEPEPDDRDSIVMAPQRGETTFAFTRGAGPVVPRARSATS